MCSRLRGDCDAAVALFRFIPGCDKDIEWFLYRWRIISLSSERVCNTSAARLGSKASNLSTIDIELINLLCKKPGIRFLGSRSIIKQRSRIMNWFCCECTTGIPTSFSFLQNFFYNTCFPRNSCLKFIKSLFLSKSKNKYANPFKKKKKMKVRRGIFFTISKITMEKIYKNNCSICNNLFRSRVHFDGHLDLLYKFSSTSLKWKKYLAVRLNWSMRNNYR